MCWADSQAFLIGESRWEAMLAGCSQDAWWHRWPQALRALGQHLIRGRLLALASGLPGVGLAPAPWPLHRGSCPGRLCQLPRWRLSPSRI